MAPDDRERTFDKALARHLHPQAPGEADASHPDAEILAAYHERLLPSEQMISWKGHIAGCARCQEILAQLEATDALPVDAGQQEREAPNVLTMPGPDLAQLAHVPVQAPTAAEPRSTAAARWSRRLQMLPGANWRWLAPAGVLAAGLLLWVAFHENRPPQFQLAKNGQLAAPAPASATVTQPAAPANNANNKEAAAKDVPIPSADARAGAPQGTAARAQNEQAMLAEKKLAPAQADKLTAPRIVPTPTQPSAPADRDAHRSGITAGITAEQKELQKQAPSSASSPTPPEPKDNSVDNMVVLVPPSKSDALLPKAKNVTSATGRQAPQAPQQQEAAAGVSGLRESSTLRMANARTSVTIAAPGYTVLWRVAPAGIIRLSTDAGSTWTVQTSGVVTDLLAGSALSDKVCWIVGRSGTILRTTDGGAHWLKISSPINDDLASVFAVDAQQATVSAASTHKTYKTPDAGQTWTALPTQ